MLCYVCCCDGRDYVQIQSIEGGGSEIWIGMGAGPGVGRGVPWTGYHSLASR